MGDYEDMAGAAIPVLILVATVFAIMVVGAVGLGWWMHG